MSNFKLVTHTKEEITNLIVNEIASNKYEHGILSEVINCVYDKNKIKGFVSVVYNNKTILTPSVMKRIKEKLIKNGYKIENGHSTIFYKNNIPTPVYNLPRLQYYIDDWLKTLNIGKKYLLKKGILEYCKELGVYIQDSIINSTGTLEMLKSHVLDNHPDAFKLVKGGRNNVERCVQRIKPSKLDKIQDSYCKDEITTKESFEDSFIDIYFKDCTESQKLIIQGLIKDKVEAEKKNEELRLNFEDQVGKLTVMVENTIKLKKEMM